MSSLAVKQGAGWQADARNTRRCIFSTRRIRQDERQLYTDAKVTFTM